MAVKKCGGCWNCAFEFPDDCWSERLLDGVEKDCWVPEWCLGIYDENKQR